MLKREAITKKIYDSSIKSSQKFKYNNLYQSARLRLALALLLVTGIRISELLPLKMNQVESLFIKHWISINRVKRDPANHKAFVTKEVTMNNKQKTAITILLSVIIVFLFYKNLNKLLILLTQD